MQTNSESNLRIFTDNLARQSQNWWSPAVCNEDKHFVDEQKEISSDSLRD